MGERGRKMTTLLHSVRSVLSSLREQNRKHSVAIPLSPCITSTKRVRVEGRPAWRKKRSLLLSVVVRKFKSSASDYDVPCHTQLEGKGRLMSALLMPTTPILQPNNSMRASTATITTSTTHTVLSNERKCSLVLGDSQCR